MFRADPELGFKAPATLVYYSVDHDIAFLGVDLKDIDPAARVRYSVLDPAAYDDLEADDPAFIYSLRYTKQAVNPNQDKHYLRVFDRYGYIADPGL